ncbi:MAG: S8 family serine peptidase, partial [Planctomycetota bacterium]
MQRASVIFCIVACAAIVRDAGAQQGGSALPTSLTTPVWAAAEIDSTRENVITLLERVRDAQAGSGEHPTRLLVRFKPGVGASRRGLGPASFLARGHRFVTQYQAVDSLCLIEVPAGEVPASLDAYNNDPDVLYAEPDYVVRTVAVPNDPDFDLLWGLQNTGQTVNGDPGTAGVDIRAVGAWDLWTGGGDFRIAVIDSGIDYNHPDLIDNIWTNPAEIPGNGIDDDANGWMDDVHGYDTFNEDPDPMDDYFHGTHVAGTIGAVGDNATGVVG